MTFQKRLSIFSVLTRKLKSKSSIWPSVIIYRALSFLRWYALCSNKAMLSEKAIFIFQRDLYQDRTQSVKKMSEQNLTRKDFRNRMKEKSSDGKRNFY